jgi:predicted SAM-dependent methyltransferase
MFTTAQKVWHRARRLMRHDGPHTQVVPQLDLRTQIAYRYLCGDGIEIGALHNPLSLPPAARVRYVDRLGVEDLRRQYPELASYPLVPVHIVDNGEHLSSISDASQDFVIANHFIEHCQDPIGTMKHFFRVLKPQGVLYGALPDKRYTFDQKRAVTEAQHLWDDHLRGPALSRRAHFEDYVQGVHADVSEEEKKRLVEDYLARNYSIHYHVWTQKEIIELLLMLRSVIGYEIELIQKHDIEVIFILRKNSD